MKQSATTILSTWLLGWLAFTYTAQLTCPNEQFLTVILSPPPQTLIEAGYMCFFSANFAPQGDSVRSHETLVNLKERPDKSRWFFSSTSNIVVKSPASKDTLLGFFPSGKIRC